MINLSNGRELLVSLMTPQAVRRKDAYHVYSAESSWIVSEISLCHVKRIIPGAIWTNGGHYFNAVFILTFLFTQTELPQLCADGIVNK